MCTLQNFRGSVIGKHVGVQLKQACGAYSESLRSVLASRRGRSLIPCLSLSLPLSIRILPGLQREVLGYTNDGDGSDLYTRQGRRISSDCSINGLVEGEANGGL